MSTVRYPDDVTREVVVFGPGKRLPCRIVGPEGPGPVKPGLEREPCMSERARTGCEGGVAK